MASHRKRAAATPDAPFVLEEAGHRAARLEHLIYEEMDRLFRMEVRDRDLQSVIITSLHLSPDLRNAKVYYALRNPKPRAAGVDPREAEVQRGVARVAPFLRARVAEALSIKRAPELHFSRDRMAEASLRAEDVLAAERAAARAALPVVPEVSADETDETDETDEKNHLPHEPSGVRGV